MMKYGLLHISFIILILCRRAFTTLQVHTYGSHTSEVGVVALVWRQYIAGWCLLVGADRAVNTDR